MKKTATYLFTAFLFAIFAGAFSSAEAQTVSGSIAKGTVTRGRTARGTIVLDIPAGLHVNSNKPSSQFLIATTVKPSANGARVTGVIYPRGKNRKFEFSDEPLNVYEGRVVFPFTVRVPAGYKGNTLTVRAAVRFQACSEEVCYPPKTRNITLTARVR